MLRADVLLAERALVLVARRRRRARRRSGRRRGGARGRRAGRGRAARSRRARRPPRRRARNGARGSRGGGRACRAGRARSPPARRRGSPCSPAPRCRRASRAPRRITRRSSIAPGDVVAFVAIEPALAGGDVLRRVEREARRVRDRADLAAAVARLDRVRRVLDHRDAELEQRVEVGRLAGEVHRQDRLRPRPDELAHVLRVDVQVALAHVGEDRRRAAWTITFAVAGHVIGRRDHLVAGPDAEREQREVQRGGARGDGEHVLAPEVAPPNALLELGRLRAGRQPARADRLGDRLDLLLADGGRLEAEERVTSRRAASTVTKRMRVGGGAARCERLLAARRRRRARRPRGRRRAAAATKTKPRLAVDPHADRRPRARAPPRRPSTAPSTPGRRDEEDARRRRPPAARARSARRRLAERGRERERRSGRRRARPRQSSASWPPPSRAASSTTRAPVGADAGAACTSGPSSIPSAAAAARAASTAARAASRARPDVGERDAERGRLGHDSVGHRQRDEAARRRRTRSPSPPARRRAPRRARAAARRRERGLERARRAPPASATSASPFWPCRSGALTTHGSPSRSTAARASSSERQTAKRGCGTPASAKRSRWRELRRREHAPSAARSDAAARAAPRRARRSATGQSIPGERSRRPARRRASRSIAGLVLGRDDRPPRRRSGTRAPRVAVDARSSNEAVLPRGLRAARSAPRPPLGRGDGCGRSPPPVPATRPDSRGTTRRCARARRSNDVRARQPVSRSRLVGRADVAVDLAEPLRHVRLQSARLAEAVEHEVGDVRDGDVDAGRDVDDLACDARRAAPR